MERTTRLELVKRLCGKQLECHYPKFALVVSSLYMLIDIRTNVNYFLRNYFKAVKNNITKPTPNE